MSDEAEKDSQVEKLKKEMAKLELEEQLLRKHSDKLKWEEEMLSMEDGPKRRGGAIYDGDQEVKPVAEAPAAKKEEVSLDPGATYLIFELFPERSIQLFLRELNGGMKGLYITRSNPNQVMKKYDLKDSKIAWLTGVRATSGILSISGMQELSITVSNAIDEASKTVILLDGLEYLISNNDFAIVLRLVQQIRDKVSTSESKLIMPLNPGALDSRQLTLLEGECRTLR